MAQRQMMKFKLKTVYDGVIIEVDEDVAFMSGLIKNMAADYSVREANDPRLAEPVPINGMDAWTLQKLMDWCTAHRGEVFRKKADHENQITVLTPDDMRYLDVTEDQMLAMLEGADHLKIEGVLDICCQYIANLATGKTVEQIREIYGFENDLSPEEEEELRLRFAAVEDEDN